MSRRIHGWTRGEEAIALAELSRSLPPDAVIIEIGAFLGSSTVLLAGPRKLRGSGKVVSIDPFDGSGDAFSVPFYKEIIASLDKSQRQCFDENIRRAHLEKWVEVFQERADEAARRWSRPIDLLFMDGDQSYEGVGLAYRSWAPFLKKGGILAVHNSRSYERDHDGHTRLALEEVREPSYFDVRCVGTTTFARKS
jgi:predicted O-methyltransferase YrrM